MKERGKGVLMGWGVRRGKKQPITTTTFCGILWNESLSEDQEKFYSASWIPEMSGSVEPVF